MKRDSVVPPAARGPYAVDRWLEAEDVRDIREHFFISVGKHMQAPGHQMMAEMLLEVVMELGRRYPCKAAMRAAIKAAAAAEAAEAAHEAAHPIPTYYPNIVERRTESCITPQQLMRVSKAAGWALKDERSPQGEHKFGVVATEPGSWLNMSLDTRPSIVEGDGGGGQGRGDKEVDTSHSMVTISYLKSYEHMGTVRGSCGGGCACDDFTIDANWAQHTSELSLHTVGYLNNARHHTGAEAKASCLLTHAGASLCPSVPLSLSAPRQPPHLVS